MTHEQLLNEWLSACRGDHAHDARLDLVEMGIHLDVLEGDNSVGFSNVERDGEVYRPAECGEPAWIFAETEIIPKNGEVVGRVLDLVAVLKADPSVMLTRCGVAWALGAAYRPSLAFEEPLFLFSAVEQWLKNRRVGLVILDHTKARHMIGVLPEIDGAPMALNAARLAGSGDLKGVLPKIVVHRRQIVQVSDD